MPSLRYFNKTSYVEEEVLALFPSDFEEIRAMQAKYPTKEERKVMEAERAKAKAEEEANALVHRASMEEEEARRQAVIAEYERQLREQRENLLRLENEREQFLNGPSPPHSAQLAAGDFVSALLTVYPFKPRLNLSCLGLCPGRSSQWRQEEENEEGFRGLKQAFLRLSMSLESPKRRLCREG